MSALLKGLIRNGRVETDNLIDMPDGTEVILTPDTSNRNDGPMTPEEFSRTLAAMQRLRPIDLPEADASDLDDWERKLQQRGIDHIDESMEEVFR
jgi:hypothetical protein